MDGGQPVRPEYLVFGRPSFSEDEIQDIVAVLRSGWVGMGTRTLEFERRFAEYCGAKHAVSVASCTAGLHVALLAAGVGPGDEVITTAMTFAATVNAIRQTGATPVLVDIDPATLNLTTGAVARAVTPRTRAILPVHFGGLPCDLDGLAALARTHGLAIVEDAAHAVGGVYHGTRIGGHGNLTCFSFYPNKNITTIEGGMITTDDDRLAEQMRLLRLHGLSSDAWKRYASRAFIPSAVVQDGFKYNMTDVQSALGLGQLGRLEEFLAVRERYAARFDAELDGLPFDRQVRPAPGGPDRHALHLYVILLRLEELTAGRDEILAAIRAENIGVTTHYLAINEHPHYQKLYGYGPGDFPAAERVSASTLTLPLSPSMSDDDVSDVIVAVRSALAHYRVGAGHEARAG